MVADETEIMGVNSRVQLADAEAVMRRRLIEKWMDMGLPLLIRKILISIRIKSETNRLFIRDLKGKQKLEKIVSLVITVASKIVRLKIR